MRSRDEDIARLGPALGALPDLRWALLFGSAARDERYEDLDIGVMPAREVGLLELARWSATIEAALTPRSVDLVDLSTAPLTFLGAILPHRVLLLDRDRAARVAWEVEVTSRWLDFQPSWERACRLRRQVMLRRIRAG